MSKNNDLKVFISNRNAKCDECKEELGKHAWITLNQKKGAFCLSCSDMDHLVFLPSGSAALTRRSKKYSTLFAVVLKWSKSRKRYERQGLLVEEEALSQAEEECLADQEVRARKNERAAERRAVLDKVYIKNFSAKILRLFPNCPKKTATKIAEHACQKYSGRVGRSAAAKQFDSTSIRLAVIAHIRHTKTNYHQLLSSGTDRMDARKRVQKEIEKVVAAWEGS